MATMTIRNIDEKLKARLRVRAALHGKSMADEARDILRSALSTDEPAPRDLGRAIRDLMEPLGGIDLPKVPREPIREPKDLEA